MDCSASKPSDCTQLIFQFYRICFNHLLNDGRGAFARNVTTRFGLTRTFHNMTMLAIARQHMTEPEPASEIWVPVQQTWFFGEANCTNKTIVFVFIHWIEPETKTLEVGAGAKNVDAWSWNRIPKIEFGSTGPSWHLFRCKWRHPTSCASSATNSLEYNAIWLLLVHCRRPHCGNGCWATSAASDWLVGSVFWQHEMSLTTVFHFYSFLFLWFFYFNTRNRVWIGWQEPILTTRVMTDSLPQVVSSYYQ